MVNTTRPEIKETKAQNLPPASLEALKSLRQELCFATEFKLQTQQRFLRRALSPENPLRNLLMVHGTGTGKTCTAIQVAEEFIVRPEFQTKRVLVLANPSVQENFKSEIFNVNRLDSDPSGVLLSKQCTGRRYLDIIQRAQAQPIRITDVNSKKAIRDMAGRIFSEFYEFQGYRTFANYITTAEENKTANDYTQWIHDTFDNRLIIVDEAHNLRVDDPLEDTKVNKKSAEVIENITKFANNVTLVLLTATPMFDSFDEIIYYFNLFLWNDRRLDYKRTLKVSDFFDQEGSFKEGQEVRFRGFCQDYVSYIKGDNPFTFPFRLPPPSRLVAEPTLKIDHFGNEIVKQRKFLTLTKSFVSPIQEKAIRSIKKIETTNDPNLICSFPNYKNFSETFEMSGDQYGYRKDVEKFLSPSKIGLYSSKFALIMNILNNSTGIAYVYSNLVTNGAMPFAMCLEEHGFDNALTENVLKNPSGETAKGSKGKYVLFTGKTSDAEITKAILRLKTKQNADGSDIRVIVASPKVSEGVDFKFVRQIHVLDPWFNMSRIEQILGRGMRTCSHDSLSFEKQNCTVYLHVCRYPNSAQEALDEYIYRIFVEEKGASIARVKRIIMESSMDCDLQNAINNLPKDWRELKVPQLRSQDQTEIKLLLQDMTAPTFQDAITDLVCRTTQSENEVEYERPLSTILDIRDEVFDKLLKIFLKKPIWKMSDLYSHPLLKQYSKSVLDYLVQNAIESQFLLKGTDGRVGKLQSNSNVVSLTFEENNTMVEKLVSTDKGSEVVLPIFERATEDQEPIEVDINAKRAAYPWPAYVVDEFDENVLNWFIVDEVLTLEERLAHFLTLDWSDPPIYAENLRIEVKPGNYLYVLGAGKLYDTDGKLTIPIGEEQDAFNRWITEQINNFIAKKDLLFGTVKDGRFAFNLDDKSKTKVQVVQRSKVVPGRACTAYHESILELLVRWISGKDFPAEIKDKAKGVRCMHINLLMRRAVLQKKEGLFWIPSPIYEIFKEDEYNKRIRNLLK
jgi:superfamily II DNA or RNA helicase